MTTLQAIVGWLAAFYAHHEGVSNLFGAAAVINMPRIVKRDGPFGVLYGWLYDTLQSFLGSIKPHVEKLPVEQNPTQAAEGK